MPDSLPLIRALPFPRACLPIGYVLIELEQLGMSMIVLTAIVLGTGEPLTWYWLLAIPVLALQSVFNIGMGLFLARLGAGADDFSQLHTVPGPDLDVRLRRHVQHPDDQHAAGSSDYQLPAADQPGRGLHQPDTERDPAVPATWLAWQQAVQPRDCDLYYTGQKAFSNTVPTATGW